MSRYIDADAVFELFKPFKDALDDEKVKSAYIQTLTLIHNAPSIDIVRCKECKWYKQSEAFCENGNGLWQAGDDCFCSYGERESE